MPISRRSTLYLAGRAAALGTAGYFGWRHARASASPLLLAQQTTQTAAPAPATTGEKADDQRKTPRSLGGADAKVTVMEFFSLTCTHCAGFARDTMPQIEKELITPGKVRFVYHDFPLDQVALTAAMVARYLPPNRYYPFVNALFANLDRWAFARGVNSTDELWKMAALAGMSRPTFDQAIADTDLRDWILLQQQTDRDRWKIDATPSFVINDKKYAGEMTFDAFRKLVAGD
jgi:protein-disulfide isomerase